MPLSMSTNSAQNARHDVYVRVIIVPSNSTKNKGASSENYIE